MKGKIGLDLHVGNELFESQRVDFLNRYEKTREDFVVHFPRDPRRILTDESNDYHGQDWQFRIKIDPNQDNLEKAVKALAFALQPYNLQYKLMRHLDQNQLMKWDGAFATKEHGPFDRSQIGKECCVYMNYSSRLGKFQYSPEEYKHIMLVCVKALQDQGVKFGTALSPQGDVNVPCEPGILPILSYTAFRPFKGRHLLLHNNNHNPLGFQDPLAGIKITKEDLRKYKIDLNALEAEYNCCLDWHEKHLESAIQSVCEELKSIQTQDNSIENELLIAAEDLRKEITDNTKMRFLTLVPRDPDNQHRLFSSEKDLERNIEQRTLNDHLSEVFESIREESEKTLLDFKTNQYAYNFLITHQFISTDDRDDKKLKELIRKDLAMMQVIYVRLVFIAHEEECLTKDSLNKQRSGLTENPINHHELWSSDLIRFDSSVLQQQATYQLRYPLTKYNRSLGSWLLTTGFTTTLQTIFVNRMKKIEEVDNGIDNTESTFWPGFLRTLKKFFLEAYGFDGYNLITNMIISADGQSTEYTGQSLPFWLMLASFLGLPTRPDFVKNGVPKFTFLQLLRNFIGVCNPVREFTSDANHNLYQYRWTEKKITSGLILFFKIVIVLPIKIISIPFKITLNIFKLFTEFLLPVVSYYIAILNSAMFSIALSFSDDIGSISLRSFLYGIGAVLLGIITIGLAIIQYATVLACRIGLALTSPAKSALNAFVWGRNLIIGNEGSMIQVVISNIMGVLGFMLSLTLSAVLWIFVMPLALGALITAIPGILTGVTWSSQLPFVAPFLAWLSNISVVAKLGTLFGKVSSILVTTFGPAVTILASVISVQVPTLVMSICTALGLILIPVAALLSQVTTKLSDLWVRWIEQAPFSAIRAWFDSQSGKVSVSIPPSEKVYIYQLLEGEEYIVSKSVLHIVTQFNEKVKKVEGIEIEGYKAQEFFNRAAGNVQNSPSIGARLADEVELAGTDIEPVRYLCR